MKKFNLHTHTTLCDGKNTLEEMTIAAIEAGFNLLGFSGHSYTPFDESYCMSLEGTLEYKREIARLSSKYDSEITLLCGVEQDYYSNQPVDDYDYVIGSVHAFYNKEADKYLYVDYSADQMVKDIDEFYGGNALAFARDYFERVSHVCKQTKCNIIGHFDLVTKFNERFPMFDESHPVYINSVDNALARLLPSGAIFEINTGAMSKGYRTKPYPSESILKKICAAGGKVIISSDSHSSDTIDFAFDDAKLLAKSCGFESLMSIDEKGKFFEVPL